MKVLLIQPPYTIRRFEQRRCQPPLGLAYLASALKGKHDVLVIDSIAEGYNHIVKLNNGFIRYGLSYPEIRQRIKRFHPNVIGVSCLFTTQSENAHDICRLTKEIDSRIITVLGGAHPSALPKEQLDDPYVDFVVLGEGEESFQDLLGELQERKDFSLIDGLAFRQDGTTKVNAKTKFIQDLDRLLFPNWELIGLEKYAKINSPHGTQTKQLPFAPVLTSRGCPNHCVFCSVHNIWGRRFRKRSPENVLAEIEQLNTAFGVKEVHFEDDNLTLDKTRAEQIFHGLKEKEIGLSWSTPNGVFIDTIDQEMLSLMKESGCYSVSFGIESGDSQVLANIVKKSLNLARIPAIITYSRQIGLETSVFFVVGFPDETKQQLKHTFRLARNLRADSVNFFFATALPGTELYTQAQQRNLLPNSLNNRELRSDRPTIKTNRFSQNELIKMVAKERLFAQFRSLFFSPERFYRKLIFKFKQCLKTKI